MGDEGRKLTLGIRPEHLRPGGGGLQASIELVEPLGSESVLHGRLPDGTPITARLPGAVHADGAMGLVIPPEQLHVFDALSGKRIEAGG
jgi:sn-glycerol 3-phosphate transport system ATP-binding protein